MVLETFEGIPLCEVDMPQSSAFFQGWVEFKRWKSLFGRCTQAGGGKNIPDSVI